MRTALATLLYSMDTRDSNFVIDSLLLIRYKYDHVCASCYRRYCFNRLPITRNGNREKYRSDSIEHSITSRNYFLLSPSEKYTIVTHVPRPISMRRQEGRDLGTKVAACANTYTVFQLTTDFDTWSIDCNRVCAIRAIRSVPDTSAIYVRGLSCPRTVIQSLHHFHPPSSYTVHVFPPK